MNSYYPAAYRHRQEYTMNTFDKIEAIRIAEELELWAKTIAAESGYGSPGLLEAARVIRKLVNDETIPYISREDCIAVISDNPKFGKTISFNSEKAMREFAAWPSFGAKEKIN